MRRRTVIGLTVGAIGSMVTGAVAFAAAGHGHGRETMMRRMVAGAIDDALDEARVSPEQRATIHAARDRVFAAVQDHQQGRQACMADMLTLFEGDGLDTGLQGVRQRMGQEHEKIADVVSAALVDAHAALTPTQRKTVADYVRSRRHMAP